MNEKIYVSHSDAGHGWLAVKRSELVRLGILNKITCYSYQRGKTVYIEEDCDASTFFARKKELGEEIKMRSSYQESSPIRSYESFYLTKEEQ